MRTEFRNSSVGEQLTAVGLGTPQLSDAGRENLSLIAGFSEKLGLLTTDKESVLAAVSELRKQQWNADEIKVSAFCSSSSEISRKS